MKKLILFTMAVLLGSSAAFAQEQKPAHFKLYGFIRHYLVADTRAVSAGTEDLYFYMPKDIDVTNGYDANAAFNWRFASLTTRLGLDVSGYKWGTMGISGKVEADFYNESSFVPIFRLRQAFIKLAWDNAPVALTLGQAWHPMAADMPHMNNLETGAPFNPFNRSPQITADFQLGKGFSFTASMLYLGHYMPTGPNGKTKDYTKFGAPEFYFGFSYKNDRFLGRLGVDITNIRPYRSLADWRLQRLGNGNADMIEVRSLMTTFSPFLYLQYSKNLFQLKFKTILAQSGEHMNLLSGYGVSSFNPDGTITYTPMQDWASFLSFSYGKKFQVMAMAGYMKQLGTTKELTDNTVWLNTSADTRIQQAFRVTPTVAWNLGKFTLSLEYNYTLGEYGNNKAAGFNSNAMRNGRGLYELGETHWVHNHRFIFMTKFNF